MRPVNVTVGPVGTVSATNICTSQTPGAAGALTLNGALVSGGVATLPTPQRVLITTADNTHTFTVTGNSPTGTLLTEVVGPITTSAYTALDYATVTSIVINAAATAAVTVGTNGIASAWVHLDPWAASETSIQCDVTGTVNYTIQVSNDNPNSSYGTPPLPSAMVWLNTNDASAVGATTSLQTNFFFSPIFARVLLNSGSGSVKANFTQFGVVNR
jgi:hypothetical protein